MARRQTQSRGTEVFQFREAARRAGATSYYVRDTGSALHRAPVLNPGEPR